MQSAPFVVGLKTIVLDLKGTVISVLSNVEDARSEYTVSFFFSSLWHDDTKIIEFAAWWNRIRETRG